MSNISIIYQKELKRIFSDMRQIFSLFILPVIMVIAIYSLMSVLMHSVEEDQSAHVASVAIYHMPDSLRAFVGDDFFEEYEVRELQDDSALEGAKNDILHENVDLVLAFDEDFDRSIADYQAGDQVPDVHTFYNPSSDYSANARNEIVYEILEDYRQSLLSERFQDMNSMEIFSVDIENKESRIQDDDKAAGEMLGSFIPYLVTLLLFAGGMGIGVDMIAGEKERGTMASLLITPMPRTSIVMGKLLAMMTISGLSALIYVVSMVVSIPFLMDTMLETDAGAEALETAQEATAFGMSMSFRPWQVWMLIIIILTMVFVYVAVIALTSILAKDIKEASTYITPIYMVVMLCGMVTMFTGDNAGTGTYLIPFYGAVIAIKNILGQDISMGNCWLCALIHVVVGGILVLIVAKAFDSERIMFDA